MSDAVRNLPISFSLESPAHQFRSFRFVTSVVSDTTIEVCRTSNSIAMSETSAAKNQEDEKITPRSTSKNDGEIQSAKAAEESTDFSSRISERTTSSSGSFAERLAARGKSVATDRPNTARFKSMPPSRLPISRPNCINLPPGLSPTTLLDSPVLLSTSQSEPSPTTGTFPLHPFITWRESRGLLGIDPSKEMSIEKGSTSDFLFKPFSKQGSRNPLSPLSSLVR